AEAVVQLALRVDAEGGGPLLVERAQALPARAHPPQVGLRAHDLDHVGRLPDALDRVLGEQAHAQNPCGTASSENVRTANRSVIPASQSTTRSASLASGTSGGGGWSA